MSKSGNNSCGPVARKVLKALEKEKKRKTIDFDSLRIGAKRAAELERGLITETEMRDLDPLHAVYTYAQNRVSVLVEQLTGLPPCAGLAQAYADAEDEYMPSGPPMSPLTMSYFFCWGVFDSAVGDSRETLGTVAIEVGSALGMEDSVIALFRHMQESRMGFYMHQGTGDSLVMLKELITGKEHACIVPAGYMGQPGEMWFVRVLPEPFDAMKTGRLLVFNTPYVIGTRSKDRFSPANPQEWEAFFDRTLPRTGIDDSGQAHTHLMKYGLTPNYWNEYVMEGYVNHRQDMILLAGFPDVPSSRPHSRMAEDVGPE